MAFIPNTPWLETIRHFDGEAIASAAVRLAPIGRIDIDTLMRLHLDMPWRSASGIGELPAAIAELAVLGSFDHEKLSMGSWRMFKDRVVFLDEEMPIGWFSPERRRIAPARLAADGADAHIKNLWLLAAVPCDIETGEVLVDRCPACFSPLGWVKLQNIWSCAACQFDIRTAAPRWCPPETVAAAEALVRYILDRQIPMPDPLEELPSLDILKIASWLAYFRALPNELNLAISAKNAAMGFAHLRRWPDSFDEVVLHLLGGNPTGDAFSRHTSAGKVLAAIDRLPSAKARELVSARLMHVLSLAPEFIQALQTVTEPVLQLGIATSQMPRRR